MPDELVTTLPSVTSPLTTQPNEGEGHCLLDRGRGAASITCSHMPQGKRAEGGGGKRPPVSHAGRHAHGANDKKGGLQRNIVAVRRALGGLVLIGISRCLTRRQSHAAAGWSAIPPRLLNIGALVPTA